MRPHYWDYKRQACRLCGSTLKEFADGDAKFCTLWLRLKHWWRNRDGD